MSRVTWCALAGALLAAALAACSARPATVCQADADCPSASKCVLGACVAGALPEAKIVVRTPPAERVSHRVVSFDGSLSRDPNPGGSIREYAWQIRHGGGGACDPDPASGSSETLSTVFTCAGAYQVALQVTNDIGLQSADVQQLDVDPSRNPPVITSALSDLAFPHRCDGSPPVCAPVVGTGSDFILDVTAEDVESQGALAYEWSWSPPPGIDPASVRVSFHPDARTRTPTVSIRSDGTAIAGDWTFRVLVKDGDGLVTPGRQKVTIGDQPPVVAFDQPAISVGHRYQPDVERYYATGTVTARVADPDGDPVSAEASVTEDPPGSCQHRFFGQAVAAGVFRASFEVTCPRAGPHDLIGPRRRLVVTARDVNGRTTSASQTLEVLNNPPRIEWSPSAQSSPPLLQVAHSVEDCSRGRCFVATGSSPLVAVDDDGDPLSPLEITVLGADPAQTAVSLTAAGAFRVEVPLARPAAFADGSRTSPVRFQGQVRDPWSSSDAGALSASFGLSILDGQPAARLSPQATPAQYFPLAFVAHSYSRSAGAYLVTADLFALSDPEGDPMVAVDSTPFGSGGRPCTVAETVGGLGRVKCRWAYDLAGDVPLQQILSQPYVARVVPFDGWLYGSPLSVSFLVGNRPPSVTDGELAHDEACVCLEGQWTADPSGCSTHQLEPLTADPDGDPLAVTVATATPGRQVCLPGGRCPFTVTACGLGRSVFDVTATDGVASGAGHHAVNRSCWRSGPCL